MATLSQVREALAGLLDQLSGLHAYGKVRDSMNLPAVAIGPARANFTAAMGRGTDTWTLNLYVLVSDGDKELAQDQLDSYVNGSGPKSIRQAIFNNRTLGLPDTDAHVSALTEYGGFYSMVGIDNVGATLQVTVHTRGTE